VFELIFGLPRGIRKKAVNALKLEPGNTAVEIGCGTGSAVEVEETSMKTYFIAAANKKVNML
jgi:precorrin-6B methylase 2